MMYVLTTWFQSFNVQLKEFLKSSLGPLRHQTTQSLGKLKMTHVQFFVKGRI